MACRSEKWCFYRTLFFNELLFSTFISAHLCLAGVTFWTAPCTKGLSGTPTHMWPTADLTDVAWDPNIPQSSEKMPSMVTTKEIEIQKFCLWADGALLVKALRHFEYLGISVLSGGSFWNNFPLFCVKLHESNKEMLQQVDLVIVLVSSDLPTYLQGRRCLLLPGQ